MYQQPTSQNPHLTAKTKLFLDELARKKAPPLYTLSYEEARDVLLGAQTQTDLPAGLDCDIEDVVLPVSEDKSVDVRFYRPKGNRHILPLVVYYHGGGWVMGNKRTHERLMREICIGTNAAVMFVNYTASPQGQYPDILEEDYAALKHVVEQAKQYFINPDKVVVAGDSVGGNMAAVISMICKERKGPSLKKQVLLYPVTDAGMDSPSYKAFADGPWLTKKAMEYFWDAYLPDKTKRQDVFASPINATIEQLRGLPPAFVLTDENDVLRDEGEAYADKLMQAGIPVLAVRYKGTIHDFMMLDGVAQTCPAKAAVAQLIFVLKETFDPESLSNRTK